MVTPLPKTVLKTSLERFETGLPHRGGEEMGQSPGPCERSL
jgi:hypothetical protein